MGRQGETDTGFRLKSLRRPRPSVRWLIGPVGLRSCRVSKGAAGDRYHLMPAARESASFTMRLKREGEWSGENGRREKLLTDRMEGGIGADKQKLACILIPSSLPPVCLLPQFSTRTCADWANQSDAPK